MQVYTCSTESMHMLLKLKAHTWPIVKPTVFWHPPLKSPYWPRGSTSWRYHTFEQAILWHCALSDLPVTITCGRVWDNIPKPSHLFVMSVECMFCKQWEKMQRVSERSSQKAGVLKASSFVQNYDCWFIL